MTIKELGDFIAEQYRQELQNGDNVASHQLEQFKVEVEEGDGHWSVVFVLQDYWKYVEMGTQPHFQPIDAIVKWVEIKPIIPRPDKYGRIPNTRQTAYMICKSISEKGTKAYRPLETALTNSNDAIEDFISEVANNAEISLKTILDEFPNKLDYNV